MQRSIKNLVGYTISAKDGELGKVSEFYFDDQSWTIRYLVVDTGTWLAERKVLIPHSALGQTDWDSKTFQVNLTMEQVRNSPDTETKKTVTRQNELELFNHYGLPFYWGNVFNEGAVGMMPVEPILDTRTENEGADLLEKPKGDPHLQSSKDVEGYHINATDGEVGHVEDYIIDDEKWNLLFLIVDTQNWLPGRKVIVSPRQIDRIDLEEAKVYINLSQESIKNSPEFNSNHEIDKDYEKILFDHYVNAIKPVKNEMESNER